MSQTELTQKPAADRAEWVDPAPEQALAFWEGCRQDVLAHLPPEQHNRSWWSWAGVGLKVGLRSA